MTPEQKELALEKIAKIDRLMATMKPSFWSNGVDYRMGGPVNPDFQGLILEAQTALKVHELLGGLRTLLELT